mgnify:CR=1 FL=1
MVTVVVIPVVSAVPVVSIAPAVTAGDTTVALPTSVVAAWLVVARWLGVGISWLGLSHRHGLCRDLTIPDQRILSRQSQES